MLPSRANGVVVERIQHMLMRVAIGIHQVRAMLHYLANNAHSPCFSPMLNIEDVTSPLPYPPSIRLLSLSPQTDIESAIESYDLMSQRLFTHASPTLFNAGTPRPQLSSCFLLNVKEDSIEGIYDTLKQVVGQAWCLYLLL